jgi:hypothetical protein
VVARVPLNALAFIRSFALLEHFQLIHIKIDDAKNLAVIELLRVPGLLVVTAESVEELWKSLIDNFIVNSPTFFDFIYISRKLIGSLLEVRTFLDASSVSNATDEPADEKNQAEGSLVPALR